MVTEGSYRWVTSKSNLTLQDQWWNIGQPDSKTSDDDCIGVSPVNGKLSDIGCSDRFPPLCQYPKMQDPPIDPCYPLKAGVYANGKCLQLVNLNRNWTDAQTSCAALHPRAKLYEIMSEVDRTEVMSLTYNTTISTFWIGGQYRNKERQFAWATNPDISILSNQWMSGEPNDSSGEDCVTMNKGNLFNDVQCGLARYFLCQIKLLGTSQTCTSLGINQSLDGNTKCFVFMTLEKKNFTEAVQVCANFHGMLAEPVSVEEKLTIASSALFTESELLVGATDSEFEGDFVWTINQSLLRLNWWVSGQPDNAMGDEFCVAFDSGTGQLLDSSCSVQRPFMCQLACVHVMSKACVIVMSRACVIVMSKACVHVMSKACVIVTSKACVHVMSRACVIVMSKACVHVMSRACVIVMSRACVIVMSKACVHVMSRACVIVMSSRHPSISEDDGSALAEPSTKLIERALNVFLKNWKVAWLGGQDIYKNRTFQWSFSEMPVSSQHLFITNNSSQEYLVWHKTADGIFYEDRSNGEQFGFVCQTAAAPPNPQNYVAVVPKMTTDASQSVYLQVTTSYSTMTIYLQITKIYDGTVQEKTVVPLTYNKKSIGLDISGSMIISDTYVYTRYVEVLSNQPVTVVMYIINNPTGQVSSTLLLPDSVYYRSSTTMSYILHSALSDRDNAITVVSKSNGVTNISIVYNSNTRLNQMRPTFRIGNVQLRILNVDNPTQNLRSTIQPRIKVDNPTQNPKVDNPTQNPKVDNPTQNPKVDNPTQNPKAHNPTQNPRSTHPTQNPKVDYPTQNPKVDNPTQNPKVDNPTQNPKVDNPTHRTNVDNPTHNPKVDNPTQNPNVNDTTQNPKGRQPNPES
ncbi:hypothetical protein Btru_038649 [Bulinus truncatus]|nr:hypothetical protein Btru_038649 [Bulinus truncatus]